jgi:E3 ubiquitin-protein ligase FANCL
VHQPQSFLKNDRYPHIVYVEGPKVEDVDFSDAMIYQAKTTTEMEGMSLILAGMKKLYVHS